ncbi:unnamed protein product [Rotaria magnacalcarata]|uniref:Uncharacterized protein n=1 Tax=Rotaria magnacalcarata TaxID=392030 RepID=A0A819DHA9_9BILA|nr:unnamed protein product [Rotaria magnacalcarata]CAF4194771.1 unnamed protein product [Rotaria magnacalcarata]
MLQSTGTYIIHLIHFTSWRWLTRQYSCLPLIIEVKERVESETTSVPKVYEKELARSNLSSASPILAPLPVDAKSVLNRVR